MFFLEWPTWAKLIFFLGASIVLVTATAVVVRQRNSSRIKRFTLIPTEQHLEDGVIEEVVQTNNEVLFGIRAMEHEPDVDGLWNSKTVTPLHTPLQSPRHRGRETRPTRRESTKVSSARYNTSNTSSSEPAAPDPIPTRNIYSDDQPRLGSTRNRTVSFRLSNDDALTVLGSSLPSSPSKRHIASPRSSFAPSTTSRVGSSGRSRTVVISNSATEEAPDLITRSSTLRDLETLNCMEAHRNRQAAESGQLHPRIRRTTTGGITPGHTPTVSESEPDRGSRSATRSASWSASEDGIVVSISSPRRVQQIESPPVIPFRAFVESHPPPKSLPSSPPSAWTNRTQGGITEKLERSEVMISSAPNLSPPKSSPSTSPLVVTPESQQSGNVSLVNTQTRRINDGFEVLPVGTLDQGPTVKSFGLWPEPPKDKVDPSGRLRKARKRELSRSSGKESMQT